MNVPWGYQLIMNLGDCDPLSISNKENIEKCIKKCIKSTKLKALGNPIYKSLPPTHRVLEKHIDGISVVQFIETSSITMHFVNSEIAGFIDFFSCKKFDPAIVEKIIIDHFHPSSYSVRFLERRIP